MNKFYYSKEGSCYIFNNALFNDEIRRRNGKPDKMGELVKRIYKTIYDKTGDECFCYPFKDNTARQNAIRNVMRWRQAVQPSPSRNIEVIYAIEEALSLTRNTLLIEVSFDTDEKEEEFGILRGLDSKEKISKGTIEILLANFHVKLMTFLKLDCIQGEEERFARLECELNSLVSLSHFFSPLTSFLHNEIEPLIFGDLSDIDGFEGQGAYNDEGVWEFRTRNELDRYLIAYRRKVDAVTEKYNELFKQLLENI